MPRLKRSHSNLTVRDINQRDVDATRSQITAHGGHPRTGLTRMPRINELIEQGILPRRAFNEEKTIKLRIGVLPDEPREIEATVWGGGYGVEADIVTVTIDDKDRILEEDEFFNAYVPSEISKK